nr:caspase family protein [Nitrospirota bacterium]
MNRCWFLVMVGLLVTNTACSVSGAIRENFHQVGEAPPRKIPLKVGLVPDKLATQRLSAGATGTIDIELQPGVFNAVKAELANTFAEVTVLEGAGKAKDEDLVGIVSMRYSVAGGNPMGGAMAAAGSGAICKISVALREAKTGIPIGKYDGEGGFSWEGPSGGSIAAYFAISLPTLALGIPLGLRVMNNSQLDNNIPHVEECTTQVVQELSSNIQNDHQLLAFMRRKMGGAMEASGPGEPDELSALVSDVDTPPVAKGATKKNAYALVFGIEKYRSQLPKADFAASDAKVVAKYLTKTLGYAEENVVLRVNDNATRTDIQKYVETWLPNHVAKGDSVFIYYSGHGAPNANTGDAYLVPYDGDPAFIGDTGYPLKRLYEALAKLPAKDVVVVLDSCFSGAGGRSVIAQGTRPMVLSMENPILASGKTAVLAASSGAQVSSTYKQKGHGLLTYFFLKGLQGDADQDHDGVVQLKELFDYLQPQVTSVARRDFNNEQTPQLLGNPDVLGKVLRLVPEQAKP